MQRIKNLLQIALLAAVLGLVVVLIVTVLQVRREFVATLAEVRSATGEAKQAAASVREFAQFQSQQLQTGENQKLIRQSLAVGAAFVGTARLLNTTTLPAFNSALTELGLAGQEVARLTRHTDDSLNTQLLPEVARTTASLNRAIEVTAKTMNASVEKTAAGIETLLQAGVLNLEDLNKYLNDPAFQTILNETAASTTALHQSSENVAAATRSIKESLQYAPEVMQDLRDFSKAQSKYSKFVLLARILRALL